MLKRLLIHDSTCIHVTADTEQYFKAFMNIYSHLPFTVCFITEILLVNILAMAPYSNRNTIIF